MASKKLADHTLYHVAPQGFWKRFRKIIFTISYANLSLKLSCITTGEVTAVNPEISSGIPIASLNRYPQPGSRPEKYSTPASKGELYLVLAACAISDSLA
jgi:hypothetical protein